MPELPSDWFERFELGIAEFNEGKFFDCHETLERCWQEQGLVEEPIKSSEKRLNFGTNQDPHRQWVQGLIQISVAYYHLERGNVKGGLKLLHRGYDRIKKFPLISYPLNSGPFEDHVRLTIDELEALPERDWPQYRPQFPKVAHK
ncbi:MAG: DUF309 domain-containing protein [Cyanobacteria bacterium SZAS TMP-1]|nr:DUF309 domain-containing protein [Cyanobacteria bacterium SZAS TMP-1]